MPHSILVIEDEPELLTMLRDNLTYEHYRVLSAESGEVGLQLAESESPNLVLLDVMLPRMSGYEVCQRLRRSGFGAPIIMLTARNTEADRIAGLDLGASDYVGKPFSIRELVARVRAHLRQFEVEADESRPLRIGPFALDPRTRGASKRSVPLGLSPHEFDLLRYLLNHPGTPVSRHDLLREVWGYSRDATSRTVDNFVAKLRRKIEVDPDQPRHIITLHGFGYQFNIDPLE